MCGMLFESVSYDSKRARRADRASKPGDWYKVGTTAGRHLPSGSLAHSLKEARTQPDGTAVWEEEDYCSPPLAEERPAVLDTYFDEIKVEQVNAGEGWKRIE